MIKGFKSLFTGIVLFSGFSGAHLPSLVAQPSYENYSLVWSDEFDGTGLPDSKNWSYEEGYVRNDELQYYTRQRLENAHMDSGFLTIEARKDNWNGNEYTAASLYSRGKREFQYGIFEMRAKIDVRQGSWPAFWTLGVSEEWPSNGEIDIMEYYAGNLHANVAWGTDTRWSAKWDSQTKAVNSNFAKDFHIWRMLWTEDKIELYVDDFLQNTTDLSTTINGSLAKLRNPFHQKAYIMLNQAIGSNGGNPSGTTFPVRYIIDYVRVYQEGIDTTAPSVIDAVASIGGTVSILFSEVLDKGSAENISNYSALNSSVTLTSAKLQNDGKIVVLSFIASSTVDKLDLTLKGIKDDAVPANALAQSSLSLDVGLLSKKLIGKLIGNGNPYNGNSNANYSAAVDGNTSTYADCTGDTVWVGYDFGIENEMIITDFRYYPRNGYADRMNGRSIEISTDSIKWKKLYVISQTPVDGAYSTSSVVHSEPVRYIRYNGTGGYLNVSEIEFFGYPSKPTIVSHGKKFPSNKNLQGFLSEGPVRFSFFTITGRILETRLFPNDEHMAQMIMSSKNGFKFPDCSHGTYMIRVESLKSNKVLYQGLINRNQ